MTAALDAVPGGVFTLSEDLRIVYANRALGALLGRPVEDLVGKFLDTVLTGASRILFQTHVYPALKADGRVEEVFLMFASGSGEALPVLFNATRDDRDDGLVYNALVVRILSRARWERELLTATRALEEQRHASQRLADELAAAAEDLTARYAHEQRSRQFRDAFIGIVGHELRTPITTIYGMSHLLRQRAERLQKAEIVEHLEDLEREADRLRRLTEDLLVMSRAEDGQLIVAREPLVLRPLLAKAVAAEQERFPEHRFEARIEAPLPLVAGEELYVEQVISNLLSNAAKYSSPGTTITVLGVADHGGVALRVIDQGRGLGNQPPEQLFELFYRAPGARRQASGAGIGLYVCRELVGAMGGRIWATNADPPPGAEFGFWLPASAEEPDAET